MTTNLFIKIVRPIFRLWPYLYRGFYRVISVFVKEQAGTYILFDNVQTTAECNDTYTFFRYLRGKGDTRSHYILNRNNPLYKHLKKKAALKGVLPFGGNAVSRVLFLFRYALTIARAEYLVTSFSFYSSLAVLKKIGKKTIFAQHGVILLKESVFFFYGKDAPFGGFDYFVVSNDMEKRLVMEKGGYPDKAIIQTGLFRWDILKDQSRESKKRYILFSPTFRRDIMANPNEKTEYYHFINSFCTDTELQLLLKGNNIDLVLNIHHILQALGFGRSYFDLPNTVRMIAPTEVSLYIRRGSLLITDLSSIFSDFFFLEKPVIFFRPKYDVTLPDSNHRLKGIITQEKEDYEALPQKDHFIFNTVYTKSSLLDLLRFYIQNDFTLEEDKKKIANGFFTYKKGICDAFIKALDEIS